MTWTYGGDPSSNNRDAVRVRCGDTDSAIKLIEDEEIAYFLTQQGLTSTDTPTASDNDKLDLAAADVCDAIAAKLSLRVSSKSVVGISRALSENIRMLREQARRLRSGSAAYRATMKVGGIDVSDMDDLDADSTVIQPEFSIGQDDYPQTTVRNEGWEEVAG